MALVGKMKGASGTIKSMTFHKTSPFLGVVGSDRYLRVYNLILKKMTFKMHMKQKLSKVIFTNEEFKKDVEVEEEDDIETRRPMEEKKQMSLPKKMKKHTIKLPYLKEAENNEEEEEKKEVPKMKKKIKKIKKKMDF